MNIAATAIEARWASVSAPTLIVDVEIDDHQTQVFISSEAKNP